MQDDNWKCKTSIRKEKQSWKSHLLTLPHSQHLKQNPHSPLMKHVPPMCKNKSNNASQVGSKDDNWSAKLKHKKRKTKLKIPSLDSSSSFTTLEAKPFFLLQNESNDESQVQTKMTIVVQN
jgi:hypothetical protein